MTGYPQPVGQNVEQVDVAGSWLSSGWPPARKPAHRESGNKSNWSLQTLSVFFSSWGAVSLGDPLLCCRSSGTFPVSVCRRAATLSLGWHKASRRGDSLCQEHGAGVDHT
jgi:hypothetical protein